MQRKSWVGFAAVFFLLSSTLAWSQSASPRYQKKRRAPVVLDSAPPENPWYAFLGADLGYSHYSTYKNSATEAPRGGFDGGFRGLIAHYSPSWVVDGGLGLQWISNKGTNGDGSVNKDNTTNVYFDLSPRYHFDHTTDVNFQIGPEFQYWVSSDKGLNPTITGSDTIADGSNTSTWLGLQALVEWGDDTKFRVGARGLTSLNASNRTVLIGQLFFQFGFDVFHSSDAYSRKNDDQRNYERVNEDDLDRVEPRPQGQALTMVTPEATPWPAATPEPTAAPIPTPEPPSAEVMSTPAPPEVDEIVAPVPVAEAPEVEAKRPAKVILTLDVNDLPFGFNNATLPKANAIRVKKIGQFLKKNNNSWKSLNVAGYTDERGTKTYNLGLSKRRAEAVRKLLMEGGANGAKIKTIGYGESNPRDPRHNESAWAKNRRVELEFKGVKDVVLMKKAMTQ